MRYRSSGSRPLDDVRFVFDGCSAGWIDCRIERLQGGFTETVILRCSHCYDPFPEFIDWLEAIIRGADETSWTVNQEGWFARLRVVRHRDTLKLHCEQKDDDSAAWQERMRVEVQPATLVCAAYWEFRRFATSARYRPEEWTAETLFNRWKHRFGGDSTETIDQLTVWMARCRRDEVLATLFHACPAMLNDRPIIPAVPADWDSLDAPTRQSALAGLLREPVDGFIGCDLRELKSERVETWLEAQLVRK